jgi:hypothetical protein
LVTDILCQGLKRLITPNAASAMSVVKTLRRGGSDRQR